MRRAALLLGLLVIAALAVQSATAQVVRSGNLVVEIEGDISPKKLPRNELAPVSLEVSGSIATADGSHVPALEKLFLKFDRHGQLNTTGLATCTVKELRSTLTSTARRVCADALVGQGRAEAEIALPEQPPFDAGGTLLIFNGAPKGAKQVLIAHVYAFVPAPTTFVTTATIGKTSGKYATTADVKIPKIVAGQGSLIGFKAKIDKSWIHKGKKQSLLLARCANGHFYAHGDFLFSDGTKLSGDVAKSCATKG